MWCPAVSPSPGRYDSLRALATATLALVAIGTVEAAWQAHINIPGADFVFPSDVSSNRRFVVGSFCMPGRCSNFLGDRGGLTTISIPGAQDTYLSGVNNAGEVVGFAWSPDAGELGFTRRANGTVIPVTCPFATSVRPSVINEGGTVVGSSFVAGRRRRTDSDGGTATVSGCQSPTATWFLPMSPRMDSLSVSRARPGNWNRFTASSFSATR